MNLSKNIIKFRKENNYSQEELAKKLNISRQSVSKWENGDTLPSIDNLISLSGLLNISLDELITGEPYLHFPFNFGKPKNKIPAIILIVTLILTILFVKSQINNNIEMFLGISFISIIMMYSIILYAFPFDYKKYYSYWTLNKKGISYATPYIRTPGIKGAFDEYIMPIKAFLHLRNTKFISYSEIKSIEIIFEPLPVNPDKSLAFGMYTPRFTQIMRENFFFKITSQNKDIICLDLRDYYYKSSKEHKTLPSIILFLKRKKINYIDALNISNIILKKEKSFLDYIYKNID